MTSCCESEDMEVVCHRYVYERVLRSEGDHLRDQHLRPNVARRRLYQTYVRAHYGILGRGNRVFVPQCVKDVIREMFPDPGGEYMDTCLPIYLTMTSSLGMEYYLEQDSKMIWCCLDWEI